MERKLLVSRIKTPDGTILTSRHVHDYVTHEDKNGLTYMLDGGDEYQRFYLNDNEPHEDVSIYTDDPFEVIRKHYYRGSRGKNGDEPLKYVPLCEMSDEWIKNCIIYNYELGEDIFCLSNSYYMEELIYRRDKNIEIKN